MEWSHYQNNVFDWVIKGNEQYGFVNSVAGSGKSTVLEECVKRINWNKNILTTAFNTSIKDVLKEKFKTRMNVKVATFNGLAWGNLLHYVLPNKPPLVENKTELLFEKLVAGDEKKIAKYSWLIQKVIDLLKMRLEYFPGPELITDLMGYYDCELKDEGDFDEFFELLVHCYASVKSCESMFDFNDQVFFPIFKNLTLPRYDWVFVDEFQDSNLAQNELLRRSLKINGRMITFGDADQLIYGFRGSDPQTMKNWLINNQAINLPLSISYRCAKNIVREAATIVPRIEAAPGAIDGSVNKLKYNQFRPVSNDLVLCRTNAPLIKEVLDDPGQRIMLGRDFLLQLDMFFSSIVPGGITSSDGFKILINNKMERKKISIDIQDKFTACEMLLNKFGTTNEVAFQLKKMINQRDAANLIRFSSIHKAKGLESSRVWILENGNIPHPNAKLQWQREEEQRLRYVATTRAKVELNLVD